MSRAASTLQQLAPNRGATVRSARVLALAAVAMVGVAEVLHQRAGRSAIAPPGRSTVIIVLGYPNRSDGRPHPIQRWRVRLGVRAMRAVAAGRIIFTGGAAANEHTEAETMARLAQAEGVPPEAILTETRALSTWQNVAYTAPLVESFEHVIIASDPMHAKRARQYWLQQHPEDEARVVVSDDRRPFEGVWSSLPTAVVEIIRSGRERWQNAGKNIGEKHKR